MLKRYSRDEEKGRVRIKVKISDQSLTSPKNLREEATVHGQEITV
jgi:hypothetical protein